MHLRGDLVASISVSGDQRWRVSGWMLENCCYNPLHSEARYTSRIEPPQQEKDSSASSWLPPPKLIATFPIRGFCYLVECDSEILVAVSISTRPSQFSELGTKGKSLVRVRGRLVGVSRESFDLVSVLPATPFLSSNVFILLLALLLQISNSLSSLILGYRFKSVG